MDNLNTNAALLGLRNKFIAKGNASATDRYIAHVRDAVNTDVEGQEFIGFAGGIAVMNVGNSRPKLVKAINDHVDKFTHTCFMVAPYASPVKLAEKSEDVLTKAKTLGTNLQSTLEGFQENIPSLVIYVELARY